jgi:hypothetical protein
MTLGNMRANGVRMPREAPRRGYSRSPTRSGKWAAKRGLWHYRTAVTAIASLISRSARNTDAMLVSAADSRQSANPGLRLRERFFRPRRPQEQDQLRTTSAGATGAFSG